MGELAATKSLNSEGDSIVPAATPISSGSPSLAAMSSRKLRSTSLRSGSRSSAPSSSWRRVTATRGKGSGSSPRLGLGTRRARWTPWSSACSPPPGRMTSRTTRETTPTSARGDSCTSSVVPSGTAALGVGPAGAAASGASALGASGAGASALGASGAGASALGASGAGAPALGASGAGAPALGASGVLASSGPPSLSLSAWGERCATSAISLLWEPAAASIARTLAFVAGLSDGSRVMGTTSAGNMTESPVERSGSSSGMSCGCRGWTGASGPTG